MVLVGETMGVEKASALESKVGEMRLDFDTRPDTVTVKILNNPGIRVGQTLYLIEKNPDHISYKNGNILGQIKVVSLFHTSFFGWQLRGEGYLRLIEDKIMTVAMPIRTEKMEDAIVLKKQGDYLVAKGDLPQAIKTYKQSISIDPYSPEAHFALGQLYGRTGKEAYISEGFEYAQAWKNREKFYDENNELMFYIIYTKFLNRKFVWEQKARKTPDIKSLQFALEVIGSAEKLNPNYHEVFVQKTETLYNLYYGYQNLPAGPDKRNKEEEILKQGEASIKQAMKLKGKNYKFHRTAILFYYQLLGSYNVGSNVPGSVYLDLTSVKEEIRKHGKLYLTFKPKKVKVDKNVMRILDYVK